jgi:RNA polymerase sigma-70 factor (ECF subfamily)
MHPPDRASADRSAEPSEAELVDRARAGDEAAFRALVVRYEPLVAATATGMLGRGPEAEDVGQETFVRFWRSLDRFRGDSTVGTYLTRIAMNLSLNVLKRRTRMRRWFPGGDLPDRPDPAAGASREVERSETARLVGDAIRTLAPPHRAVVVLRLVQGLSTAETAAALGIPTGTVLSRLSRAQRRLREKLAPIVAHGTPDAS